MTTPHTLVVLLGPTGVGKTELSLALAERLHTPIINADSRQIYAGLPIGTAAPTPAQMLRVPHHFVGLLQPTDYYSAARYESEVLQLLEGHFRTHPHALLCGGSMMYIDAVCHGIDDIPTVDEVTREELRHRYETEGLETLCSELRLLDPEYYAEVDLKNPKRVVHALEICYMTGRPYSSFRTRSGRERPFRVVKIGLRREREELYARINARVEEMMAEGLLEEVKRMLPYRRCNALNTVGYKELFDYLDGACTLDFAIDKIKQHSRIYSRKQMTWFRRDESITWFHPDEGEAIHRFLDSALTPGA